MCSVGSIFAAALAAIDVLMRPAGFPPLPRKFYSEFGPDFEQRYQWRSRPTAGPYVIKEEDIHFGRSITFTRVKDWWAKDRKFYRHRFNVDRIHYRVVRLQEKIPFG